MQTCVPDWTERSRDLAAVLSRTALGDRAAFAQVHDSGHLFAVSLRMQRDRAIDSLRRGLQPVKRCLDPATARRRLEAPMPSHPVLRRAPTALPPARALMVMHW